MSRITNAIANPTITQSYATIDRALNCAIERTDRAMHAVQQTDAADPLLIVTAVRANAKVRALRYALSEYHNPAMLATALAHWRKHLRTTARITNPADIISAQAHIMVYAWCLGVFDEISRRARP